MPQSSGNLLSGEPFIVCSAPTIAIFVKMLESNEVYGTNQPHGSNACYLSVKSLQNYVANSKTTINFWSSPYAPYKMMTCVSVSLTVVIIYCNPIHAALCICEQDLVIVNKLLDGTVQKTVEMGVRYVPLV
jgi:hypothetical protein